MKRLILTLAVAVGQAAFAEQDDPISPVHVEAGQTYELQCKGEANDGELPPVIPPGKVHIGGSKPIWPSSLTPNESELFRDLRTLRPFLHEVWFDGDYPMDAADAVYSTNLVSFGGCSSVRNGNFHGRNYDYLFNDTPEFIVHVARKDDSDPARRRLASVGVGAHYGLREDGVTNGTYRASEAGVTALNRLPTMMFDGINECGVVINANSVEHGDALDGIPETKDGLTDPIHITYVQRLVLDSATNAQHAVEIITNMQGRLYGHLGHCVMHYMVSDPKETFVVEVVKTNIVARRMSIMTNFNLNWDNKNQCAITDANSGGWSADAYWVPPQDRNLTGDEATRLTNLYTPYACGFERFAILRDHYGEGVRSAEGMANLMRRAQYTRQYETEQRPALLSENVSSSPECLLGKITTISDLYPTTYDDYTNVWAKYRADAPIQKAKACETNRKENTGIWITVHSSVYDIPNRTLRISAQEDFDHPVVVQLDGLTDNGTAEHPWLVGAAPSAAFVRAWTNENGKLVIKGDGPMADFTATQTEDAEYLTVAPWYGLDTDVEVLNDGHTNFVTRLGANAFAGTWVDSIRFHGRTPPELGENVFSNGHLGPVTAPCGSASSYAAALGVEVDYPKGSYHDFREVAPYLYEVWYDEFAEDENGVTYYDSAAGACSAVRKGDFFGRNHDFIYNTTPTFVVHVSAKPGRFASVGVARHFGMKDDGGDLRTKYPESMHLVPNTTMDGVNECGVTICANMVPRQDLLNLNKGLDATHPGVGPDLHVTQVQRYVLDRAESAKDAIRLLKEANLYGTLGTEYVHYMIADATESYVVEVIDDKVVVVGFAGNSDSAVCDRILGADPIMTNFYLGLDGFTPHADGVERYGILTNGYDSAESTLEGVRALMKSAKFSNMGDMDKFNTQGAYYPFSDCGLCPLRTEAEYRADSEIMNAISDMIPVYNAALANEDRTTDFWYTSHSTVYDIPNRTLRLTVDEKWDKTYDFALNAEQGTAENPWRIGEGADDTVVAYTNGNGVLVIEGRGRVGVAPWLDVADEITELEKEKDVTELGEIVETLPRLEYVNGLSKREFTSAAIGLVKADGFDGIEVVGGKAYLCAVVYTNTTLTADGWGKAATDVIEVPAPGPSGFFILDSASGAAANGAGVVLPIIEPVKRETDY